MSLSTRGIIGVSVSAGILAIIVGYVVWILHKRRKRTVGLSYTNDPERAAAPNMTSTSKSVTSGAAAASDYKPTVGSGAITNKKSTPATPATQVRNNTRTKLDTKNATTTKKFNSGGSGDTYNNNGPSYQWVAHDCESPAPRDTRSHSNAIRSGYHVSDYLVHHIAVTSHSSGHDYSGGYGGGGGSYGGGGYGGGDSGGGGCSSGGGDSGGGSSSGGGGCSSGGGGDGGGGGCSGGGDGGGGGGCGGGGD
ncbi:hypothetical protein EC968_007675 [Mortierella alpina]|nr:hypothetical protein EC968_007675 [Mortierella alpina]